MEESIHTSLWRSHGPEVLKTLRKLENTTAKLARWGSHLVYNKRCRHYDLTPPSVKLNTTIRGNKAVTIIHKAERALLIEPAY